MQKVISIFYIGTTLILFPLAYSLANSADLSSDSACATLSISSKFTLPKVVAHPLMPDGRSYPFVPQDPHELAKLISNLEFYLKDSQTSDDDFPCLAHQQQVVYRVLAKNLSLSNKVLSLLSNQFREIADLHLYARRQFLTMGAPASSSALMPRWRIIPPEAPDKLLSHYKKAQEATGIDWEVLAAINLVETGMGRIDGVSIANAQGPMQFLPSTWAEKGIGMDGDIHDPHDSILAAARYLVRRGGLEDITKGLYGYNNSAYYGKAVLAYAELIRKDPLSFKALYHWEIHYRKGSYDLWLPVGYSNEESISISNYIKLFPASVPPPTTLP